MLLNIPSKITKKDIKYYGKIYKGNTSKYIISDLYNTNINKVFEMNGYGFYSYVYEIFDTYLFIIGNQIKSKDINPKNIDFIAKILKFEYDLQNKNSKIFKVDIPSNVLTIISKDKWLQDDILNKYENIINDIIDVSKPHLKDIQEPYIKYMSYLCDNVENCMGLFEFGLSKLLMYNDYIYIQKHTDFDGYIIKHEHCKFL